MTAYPRKPAKCATLDDDTFRERHNSLVLGEPRVPPLPRVINIRVGFLFYCLLDAVSLAVTVALNYWDVKILILPGGNKRKVIKI